MKKAGQVMTKKVMAMLMTLLMVLSVLPATIVSAADGGTFGSEGVTLAAGSYLVPLKLMNANNLEQDSKAAACPGRYGTLTVAEDGSATLKVKLRSVTQGTLTDWAENFQIYQKGKSGTQVPATIISKKTVQMMDNGKVKGDDKEVPTEIEFTIPEQMKDKDGVYLSMHVEAMNDSPDAYLNIDYKNAKSKDDENLNYTTDVKSSKVEQFGEYQVNAKVTVKEGQISDVELEGSDFKGSKVEDNQTYLAKAIKGMKEKLVGLYNTDEDVLNDLDVVSGATYSSNAIKEAVLNALGLDIHKEIVEPAAKEIPEPGIYTIDMKNITDVVAHSLIGKDGKNEKKTAILTVDENKHMTLTYKMVNSTIAEPLQVLKFNGYYKDNDKTKGLSMDGVTYKRDREDVNELNASVVTDITIPLQGDKPQQFYYVNNYLYVDAMKKLGETEPTEISGVLFDKGKFNIDSKITLYWDSLEGPFTKSDLEDMEFPFLEDGTYVIDGKMVQPNGETSMSDGAINHKLKLTVKNGKYTLSMNFKGLNIGSLRGYLKDLSVYKEGYTTDVQNNPKGDKEAVKVESTQKYTDGSKLSDSFGTDYPDVVSFDLIPEALQDGKVPMQVFVPIMESITAGTGTKDVYLTLDWDSVKAATADDKAFTSEDVVDVKPSDNNNNNNSNTTKPDNTTAAPSTTTTAKNNTTVTKPSVKAGQKVTVGGNTYVVTGTNKVTVRLVKAANKKSVSVPATIKVNGVTASVTEIGNNAFASAKKKVATVTIGANVTTIGSKAFANCKNLKKINVKTSKLKKVGSKALSGIHKKAVIKVPKKNKKAYTKLFKGKGQKKTVKVK